MVGKVGCYVFSFRHNTSVLQTDGWMELVKTTLCCCMLCMLVHSKKYSMDFLAPSSLSINNGSCLSQGRGRVDKPLIIPVMPVPHTTSQGKINFHVCTTTLQHCQMLPVLVFFQVNKQVLMYLSLL